MADEIMGDTELGATKEELIAAKVQKELAFMSVLTKFFTDVSVYCVPGAKSIDFPKLTSFTVVNRAEGTAGEAKKLVATLDTLMLDQNAYVSWIVDKVTALQAKIAAQLVSASRAAAAQSRYVDLQIISRIRSVCGTFLNVGADANVTYDNTVDMVTAIEEAHQVASDCVWLASPTQKGALMKLDEFKRADVYGVGNIPRGVIGFIHGAPVVVHSGLASKELFLCHKDAIAYGFQAAAEYGEESAIEYGVGAKRAAVDQLFGTVGQQLGELSAAAGKTKLIVGLND
jgi:hypothetical protein